MTPKTKKGVATIDRGIVESPVWQQGPLAVQLWIWLVLTAVYSPDGFTMDNGVALRRGQLWTTYRLMAKALRYRWAKGYKTPPIATIKRIIDGWLVERQVERLVEHNGIVLTLVNYEYYNRFKIISGTVGGTIDKTLVEQEVDKASLEEEIQILSPLEKNLGEDEVGVKAETSLSKLSSKVHADPNFEFAKAVALYFHDTNPCATKPDKTSRKDRLEAIGAICDALRIDLKNGNGSKERIWKVIHYAANDVAIPGARFDGWQKNMQSLKSLRKRNDEGKLKHENIWNRMPDHKKNAHLPMIEYAILEISTNALEGETHGS